MKSYVFDISKVSQHDIDECNFEPEELGHYVAYNQQTCQMYTAPTFVELMIFLKEVHSNANTNTVAN